MKQKKVTYTYPEAFELYFGKVRNLQAFPWMCIKCGIPIALSIDGAFDHIKKVHGEKMIRVDRKIKQQQTI